MEYNLVLEKVEQYIKESPCSVSLGKFLCREFAICDVELASMKDTEVMDYFFGSGTQPEP